jgi:hypothetical protein
MRSVYMRSGHVRTLSGDVINYRQKFFSGTGKHESETCSEFSESIALISERKSGFQRVFNYFY